MTPWLIVAAVVLVGVSGLPGLLLGRGGTAGERVATALLVAGSACGIPSVFLAPSRGTRHRSSVERTGRRLRALDRRHLGAVPDPDLRDLGARLDLRVGVLAAGRSSGQRPQAPPLLRTHDGGHGAPRRRPQCRALPRRLGDHGARGVLHHHDRGPAAGGPRGRLRLSCRDAARHAVPLRDVRAAACGHRHLRACHASCRTPGCRRRSSCSAWPASGSRPA